MHRREWKRWYTKCSVDRYEDEVNGSFKNKEKKGSSENKLKIFNDMLVIRMSHEM